MSPCLCNSRTSKMKNKNNWCLAICGAGVCEREMGGGGREGWREGRREGERVVGY